MHQKYPTRYGDMMVIAGDSVVSSSIRIYGEWAQTELDMMGKLLRKGDHVLDIGGFIGTHSLAFAHFVGTEGYVTAFEPRPELFAVLEANLKQCTSCNHAEARQCAVGAERGSMTVPSLDLGEAVNFGQSSMVEKTVGERGVEVEIIRVDDLPLTRLDLMKIDVEGMEADVLRGASGALDRFHPFIFAECNSVAAALPVIEVARQHGYSVWGFVGEAFNPDNFLGATENIFGNAAENGLLLVPEERRGFFERRVSQLMAGPITDADGLVLLMLHKPQYPHEVLAGTEVAQRLGLDYSSARAQRLSNDKAGLEIRLTQWPDHMAAEVKQLRAKNKKLEKAVESAQQWQKAWYKRAFRRWRPPGSEKKRKSFWLKLKKAFRGGKETESVVITSARVPQKLIETTKAHPAKSSVTQGSKQSIDVRDIQHLVGGHHGRLELHVMHQLGGGTERYFQELVRQKADQGCKVVVLRSLEDGTISVKLPIPIDLPKLKSIDWKRNYAEALEVLRCLAPARIHIHQLFGYPEGSLNTLQRISRALNADMVYTIHDYHPICPRMHLVEGDGAYCCEPDLNRCQECIDRNGSLFGGVDIRRWRWDFYTCFQGCSQLIVPDEDVSERLKRYFPDLHFDVCPPSFDASPVKSAAKPIKGKVVCLGAMAAHKGYQLLKGCAAEAKRTGSGIHYTVIGYTVDAEAEFHGIKVTGPYAEEDVCSLLAKEAPQAIFLSSVCPETFSFTLSVALQTNLPIIAFNFGAIGRRLRERGRPKDLLLDPALIRDPKAVASQIAEFLAGI